MSKDTISRNITDKEWEELCKLAGFRQVKSTAANGPSYSTCTEWRNMESLYIASVLPKRDMNTVEEFLIPKLTNENIILDSIKIIAYKDKLDGTFSWIVWIKCYIGIQERGMNRNLAEAFIEAIYKVLTKEYK